MKNVGEELRLSREKLGLSLEEMSNRTKIAVDRLQAIENGDLAFFDDDISYLRYYIRFYCNALGVDFNQFRDELDQSIVDFQTTLKLQKIEMNQNSEKSIKKKADFHNFKFNTKRKIDLPVLLMIIIIVVLVISLCSVFFIYILPELNGSTTAFEQSDPIIDTPIVDEPDEPTQTTDPIVTVLTVEELDSHTYQISGWKDDDTVSIKIAYGRDTWTKISYDGVVSDNPASKIYLSGSEIEILYQPKNDGEILINLGGLKNNQIYVNDTLVTLDQEITDWNSGIKLKFVFKGV